MAPVSSLTDLPEEIHIDVAARVVASSSFPMADLRRLRGPCSVMRDRVCGAPLVRRSLNLRRALRQLDNAETRERLIAKTYTTGNLEARFVKGMRVVFREHSRALHAPLDKLDQADRGGHKPAAYMLAMLLWRANSGAEADLRAKELLAEAADDDPTLAVWNDRGLARTVVEAFDTLWMEVLPNFDQGVPVPGPVPRADVHQCGMSGGHDGWYQWSYFCSVECRIQSLCEDIFRILGDHP
ncbi:hypothetical protein C2845_PM09G16950 [Panicum miliaceum]|uniref:At2g35280-like TPR domain-containing protein n=1 Tax=Panicum miliaceum TaxID=4540 RepID=A0A3L6S1Z1_PANMI|nr:hypothetical protein C2845_PM09G16950 [Panicum miliaceum]